ncbi:hypothetical protein, conserved (C-terminus) [Thermococcus kodakarensis KOD1]|uniref:DUF835 domain-containing protein n=1 Tax=Thermococcus kodakarensis (strain ATCC BAA-918 / JCM 12380 / KOD1) TaxID=69014 RepID=Q5JJA3_THEKO|nr:DUF835 domain-containing protein [Thermococcus kodakarensis]WCN28985.1 DUF835 domain-containing protein [Thermococcus kodakarensis]WCN31291.1 DUF835 domain-containing protein [Thermococcus kodakarensis]BAD85205.1 hypothetical protein, conserved (C-terminus) [Thermococcus kodakarensis KOD1]
MALVLRRKTSNQGPVVDYRELDRLLAQGGYKKLLITRQPIINSAPSDVVPIWVSKAEHPKAVKPTDLHILESIIWRELQNGTKSVILDALEYLMIENGVERALRFVGKLRDMAILTGATFYVTVSEGIDEKTRAMLRRIVE